MEKERKRLFEIEQPAVNPEIPEHIQKVGVNPSNPKPTPLTDDSGKALVTPTGNDDIQFVIPEDSENIKNWSKGSIANSLTWLGLFWLRMIKKALFLGKKIVVKQK